MSAIQRPELKRPKSTIWRRISGTSSRSSTSSPPDTPVLPYAAPVKLQRRRTEKYTRSDQLPLPPVHNNERITGVSKQPSPVRALPADMETRPFPSSSRVQTVPWNVYLTPEQVYSLVMGFRPRHVDHNWFIYSQGPDDSGKLKCHFFRSWTGLKIAEIFIVMDIKGEGAGKIVGIKWNGTEQTNRMSEDEAKYMITTTCAWVMGVHLKDNVL